MNSRDCLAKASEMRRLAAGAMAPAMRADFLAMAVEWDSLAREARLMGDIERRMAAEQAGL